MAANRIGPPRIFVEVVQEIEGGSALRTRKEITLNDFEVAAAPVADLVVNECLGEIRRALDVFANRTPIRKNP